MAFIAKYESGGTWATIGTYSTRSEAYNRTQGSRASHSLAYAIFSGPTKIWEGRKGDPLENVSTEELLTVEAEQDGEGSETWVPSFYVHPKPGDDLPAVLRLVDQKGKTAQRYTIKRGDTILWQGFSAEAHNTKETTEMDLTSDLKPLSFKREDIIASLQVKLDAEDAATKAKTDKAATAEKELADTVAKFSAEEIVMIVRKYVTSDVKQLKRFQEDGTYKPEEVVPAADRETDLARAVRVLTLSSDETIELAPTNNIYNLL